MLCTCSSPTFWPRGGGPGGGDILSLQGPKKLCKGHQQKDCPLFLENDPVEGGVEPFTNAPKIYVVAS